jgi:GH24 family phage-related lysozyme (muramidase)
MAEVTLPLVIDEKSLIEFDIFTIKDVTAVNDKILLKDLEASDKCIQAILGFNDWYGYQYSDEKLIGYGTTGSVDGNGLIESESYIEWIAKWKDAERKFKRQCPVPELSQTQYDALVSLYFHTGTILKIGTEDRNVLITDWIKEGKWNYIATALTSSGGQRNIRQREASILMLADYGPEITREDLRQDGLQRIRKRYPDQLDTKQQRQAEYVYYAETKRFLPNMSQTRMRQIVNLVNNK